MAEGSREDAEEVTGSTLTVVAMDLLAKGQAVDSEDLFGQVRFILNIHTTVYSSQLILSLLSNHQCDIILTSIIMA